MAFDHGKEAVLYIDATDVSAYTNQASLDRAKDLFDATTFGKDDKVMIDGLREWNLPFGGVWDPTLDGVMDGADDGASVVFVYGPAGTATGDIYYTGSAFISNYAIDSPVSGGITWSATFKPSGVVTRGTG